MVPATGTIYQAQCRKIYIMRPSHYIKSRYSLVR